MGQCILQHDVLLHRFSLRMHCRLTTVRLPRQCICEVEYDTSSFWQDFIFSLTYSVISGVDTAETKINNSALKAGVEFKKSWHVSAYRTLYTRRGISNGECNGCSG